MPSDFMNKFAGRKLAALEVMGATLQGVFPEDDDAVSALSAMIATVVEEQWRNHKRNILPLLVDRLRQCFEGENNSNFAEIPYQQLLEEAGLSSDSISQNSLLRRMMKEDSDDSHQAATAATALRNRPSRRRTVFGDV